MDLVDRGVLCLHAFVQWSYLPSFRLVDCGVAVEAFVEKHLFFNLCFQDGLGNEERIIEPVDSIE